MAKFNDGINGPFKGKVGTVVGATWKGIHYMRSLPSERTSPPTQRRNGEPEKMGAFAKLATTHYPICSNWLEGIQPEIGGIYCRKIAPDEECL